jgi:hypothetical protein
MKKKKIGNQKRKSTPKEQIALQLMITMGRCSVTCLELILKLRKYLKPETADQYLLDNEKWRMNSVLLSLTRSTYR